MKELYRIAENILKHFEDLKFALYKNDSLLSSDNLKYL